ncbi:hypothetical protein F0T03_08555 [Yersinia canariae]|uniref:Uncharacterized protein n=1 Tax=Yersinia canariae TaxID=2607663 RepID=A0A857EXS2_9GAMM|nr:hypothetical protein F0T03_08555 [Yersinia canariae]
MQQPARAAVLDGVLNAIGIAGLQHEHYLWELFIGDTRRFVFEAASKDNVLGGTALLYSRTLLHINRSVIQAGGYLLIKHIATQLFYLGIDS